MARAIARHIGKHIPGNPTVVVRNMPGAGGITAVNWLYNAAEKDGTVLGLVQNGTPLEPLFGTKEARYDATKFNWLGTPSFEVSMVLLWHTVPVNSLDDLKTKETNMGASGANSTPAFYTRMLNAMLGTKMKLINGYPGQNDAFLAMERGELDGYPSVFYSALTSTRPNWLRDKQAKAIVQYGPERLKELPDVPFVHRPSHQRGRQAPDAGGVRAAGARPSAADAAGRAGRSRRRDAQGARRHLQGSGLPGRRRKDRPDRQRAARPASSCRR